MKGAVLRERVVADEAPVSAAREELAAIAVSQLEHALDARRRSLKVYESLKSLNDVIGTQYGDRVLFELVQNAHDAHPAGDPARGEIAVRLLIRGTSDGELLVANRGRAFTSSNLNAIRNIGTSDKQIGEGIGNKGLGFRSVEALTDDVRIFSRAPLGSGNEFDGYCFRFARTDEIERGLLDLAATAQEAMDVAAAIPRYLVPVPMKERSDAVDQLAADGFASVVSLPLSTVEAVALAEKQVQALIDPGVPVLLFLDRIGVLEVSIAYPESANGRRLTRSTKQVERAGLAADLALSEVTLNDRDTFLLARQSLPKPALLDAVRASLAVAPPLRRWLEWQGDAIVSVAVPLGSAPAVPGRLFNFLPMDNQERAASPIAGHIDAPFFADIDRRSIKPELPLNRHLLEAAALVAAKAALAVVDEDLPYPSTAVIDFAAWLPPHQQKVIAAFSALKRPISSAAIWPVVSGGPARRAGLDTLYAWPDVRTAQLTPTRCAEVAGAAILPSTIQETRLGRIKALATAVSMPLGLTDEVLGVWAEALAERLAADKRRSPSRWQSLYEDLVALFTASGVQLLRLQGRKILVDGDGKLLRATAKGLPGAPPVFVRLASGRSRRNDGPPSPPPSLARKFRFLDDRISLSDTALRAFDKAGLLRRYDPLEVLGSVAGALGGSPTDLQLREALTWSFKVWGNGGKAVEEPLRAAGLQLPVRGGWLAAPETVFSLGWTSLGRSLEQYLIEAAPLSSDCAEQAKRLLVGFADWPRAAADDRRDDWHRFLVLLGVRDGLQVVAGDVRSAGTPIGYWTGLLSAGKAAIGLGPGWVTRVRNNALNYPQTEYRRTGEAWRLPGQLEHATLDPTTRELLSDLIVGYLRAERDKHLTFTIGHHRGFEKIDLPTPVAVFLADAAWVASLRRDDVTFAAPRESWSTTALRQISPRFVARFASEPGSRGALPAILYDARIGLRDWSSSDTAPARLAALAATLDDLSAAERRDLRDQLRRSWSDVADGKLTLNASLSLVVERTAGLEVLAPDPGRRPIVHVTSERQGFAARALLDRGEAVLDVGETDSGTIADLISAAGGFTVSQADTGDVRLQVDGAEFQPDAADALLVAGPLAWLADAAMLAHEYLGDPLETRTLPPDELERRLRLVRLRRCERFALVIAGHSVEARGDERIFPVANTRAPTLLMTGHGAIGVDLLIAAAPALTKLMGARRNTLEMILGRLARDGFAGGASGPTVEQYARAIGRDLEVIRDHFAATSGGVERRVHALLPVVAHLAGAAVSERLAERHERLGQALDLRAWLLDNIDSDWVERCLTAVQDTDDQRMIAKQLGLEFAAYGRTLVSLGYPPMNDEADVRRLFQVYLAELRPALIDRVRRRYVTDWQSGGDLAGYVEARKLDFIPFVLSWATDLEQLDRETVEVHAAARAEVLLGPDEPSIALPKLDAISAGNRKLVLTRHARLVSVIRAWCRKNEKARPELADAADAQVLVRALDAAGLLDFEAIGAGSLPALYLRVSAWPPAMPPSDDLVALGLVQADLEHEEREAREARRKAELAKRTVDFVGSKLDTGSDDFALRFEELAGAALARGTEWFSRSRAPRLLVQEQRSGDPARTGGGGSGGKGQAWQNQPPEAIRKAMGLASEWLVREYLKLRHPQEMNDDCWVSSNRAAFCSGSEGRDSLGYDFRVETERHEWLYEVKSAMDAGGEFELSAREIEVAGSASLERKRRYRILYVPYVFDPDRWRVLPLMNPVAELTRDRFRVVRSGSVRYRFETR